LYSWLFFKKKLPKVKPFSMPVMPTADKPAGRSCCCEEVWKKDVDTGTTTTA